MWHGAKVPLCKQCSFEALHAYESNASAAEMAGTFPRMLRKHDPMGHFVIRICGRNMEGMVKELGLLKEYNRFVKSSTASSAKINLMRKILQGCMIFDEVPDASPASRVNKGCSIP